MIALAGTTHDSEGNKHDFHVERAQKGNYKNISLGECVLLVDGEDSGLGFIKGQDFRFRLVLIGENLVVLDPALTLGACELADENLRRIAALDGHHLTLVHTNPSDGREMKVDIWDAELLPCELRFRGDEFTVNAVSFGARADHANHPGEPWARVEGFK